ncbi:hypothetical protein [Gloeocapsopsis dulcis]|uniref:Uncharacterized protein n=1 Tax=Gloeocapsopsis dulcis AAB1 = 1H9 TaxID=1433147 RepID=A0A6N8FTP6_9CHRO|nr:hypothetical protein [Gloeocapsopsis dulcis]MUL36229.1 hypothetical protein [Gloeocapsopsis dulcis AAB1 = 1H9]WNN89656.1 hypothetical protein P0S91_00715 [Gloeocapsopsis dulcis]
MYTLEQLKNIFDNEVVKYLVNKNIGGKSGAKGNTYENFFAVYQLALLAQIAIEGNREIQLSSQLLAFVDDFIVDCQDETPLQHYQLKNSQNETWGKGFKSISDDFKKQYELNKSISRESQINLVVSSPNLKTKLESTIPSAIKKYSQVTHFPYAAELIKLIARVPKFQQAIEYLCAFDNPAPDKIECVATVLLGAWVSSAKSQVSVMDILKKAQESTPSFIRSFSQNLQLDSEVTEILGKIPDFKYNLTKGFLHWEFKNKLEEGDLSYSIETKRFRQFQELIKKNNPTCFQELEVFLI